MSALKLNQVLTLHVYNFPLTGYYVKHMAKCKHQQCLHQSDFPRFAMRLGLLTTDRIYKKSALSLRYFLLEIARKFNVII